MNCEQFDNRVQQLLDERASLSLDLQIRKHAVDCAPCRNALEIYECMASPIQAGSNTPSQVLASRYAGPSSGQFENATASRHAWKQRQRIQFRERAALAVAALLFVSLTLVVRPPATHPVAGVDNSAHLVTLSPPVDASGSRNANDSALDFSGLIQSSWTTGLTDASYVDLSSLGRIDIVSLMPKKQVQAVQSIPATIESMEPLYRYSSDLPVINQWSSGINYTLGLIQSSIPQGASPYSQQTPANDSDDLGSKNASGSGNLA